jgi:hypothetical protein
MSDDPSLDQKHKDAQRVRISPEHSNEYASEGAIAGSDPQILEHHSRGAFASSSELLGNGVRNHHEHAKGDPTV